MISAGSSIIRADERALLQLAMQGADFIQLSELADRAYGFDGDDTIWERKPLESLAAADQLEAFFHRGFWQPMDTLRDKLKLEELWQSGDAPWKTWA